MVGGRGVGWEGVRGREWGRRGLGERGMGAMWGGRVGQKGSLANSGQMMENRQGRGATEGDIPGDEVEQRADAKGHHEK